MTTPARIGTLAGLLLMMTTLAEAQTATTTAVRIDRRPDFVITGVRVSSPLGARACIGNRNTLTVTVKNQGMSTRSSFGVGVGIYDPEFGGVAPVVGYQSIMGMSGGATRELVFTGVEGTAGSTSKVQLIEADYLRKVNEQNEGNNRAGRLPRLTGLPAADACPIPNPGTRTR